MWRIDIVVPVHNAEPWIDGFFESVLQQDCEDSRIIARDDASNDNSGERLAYWQRQLGSRMVVLDSAGASNLGMVGNYNAVLAASTAPWVMFADPDDVWLPGKIRLAIEAMIRAETAAGSETPVLVYSDAIVVDPELRCIAPSFWKWSRMNPRLASVFHRLIVESPVLSSTVMVNRPLLRLAMPLVGAAACPDWWPALVASAFGRIVRLAEQTILYRRHPANDSLDPFSATLSGAVRHLLLDVAMPRKRSRRLLTQLAPQAGAFAARFRDRLRIEDLQALEAASRLPDLGLFARRCAIIRHGLWFASPLKNAGLMLLA